MDPWEKLAFCNLHAALRSMRNVFNVTELPGHHFSVQNVLRKHCWWKVTERKIVAYLPTAPASHQPSHHTDMYMANLYSSAAYNYNRCISTPTKPAVYRIYIVYLRVYLISTPGAIARSLSTRLGCHSWGVHMKMIYQLGTCIIMSQLIPDTISIL